MMVLARSSWLWMRKRDQVPKLQPGQPAAKRQQEVQLGLLLCCPFAAAAGSTQHWSSEWNDTAVQAASDSVTVHQ